MTPWFYQNRIKNISIAVADMFDDLYITRFDTSGTPVKNIKVPCTFFPWDKLYDIRKENYTSEAGKKYYTQFPRISVGLESLEYDSERATSVNYERSFYNTSATEDLNLISSLVQDIQPVPYTLHYGLYIKTRSIDDWAQILENILPFFNNSLTLRLKEFSFLNLERDHVVTLESVQPDYVDMDSTEETRRMVNGQINLKVESYLYRPIDINSGSIIKLINSRFWIGESSLDTSASVLVGDYMTSAYSGTDTSAFPTSGYNFSAYDTSLDVYTFTSAANL